MKKILCYGLLFGLLGCVGVAGAAENKTTALVDAQKGKVITTDQLAKQTKKAQVIFFGEYHDQDAIHAVEKEVLEQLYKVHGDKLVLSLEMFEADNQKYLNDYLADKMTEEDFLAKARPWPNYKTDYRPLVEFAKAHKLPVIASNVPRFLASHLAKKGTLAGIEPQYEEFLPKHTYAPAGAYQEKFADNMKHSPMQIPASRVATMYAAQCLKDDKMAESIYYFLEAQPKKVVLHVNGCFHSDGHLGTAQKLEALKPALKTIVITPKDMVQDKNYLDQVKTDKADGEYILYFTRVKKEVKMSAKMPPKMPGKMMMPK